MQMFRTSLHARILSIIIGIFIAMGVIYFLVNKFILYPKFVRLEQQGAINNLARCKNAIDQELSNLKLLTGDWSSWSDTYAYVQHPDKTFEDSNLIDETFTSYELQLIFILNKKNKVVWGKIFDHGIENEIDFKGFNKNSFPENHPLLQFDHMDDFKKMSKTGIWVSEKGPLFIVSNPILKSNTEGPVIGTFIMGKFLSKAVVEKLKSQVQVGFKILLPDDPDESGKFHSIEGEINDNGGFYLKKKKMNYSYIVLTQISVQKLRL